MEKISAELRKASGREKKREKKFFLYSTIKQKNFFFVLQNMEMSKFKKGSQEKKNCQESYSKMSLMSIKFFRIWM